MRGGSICKRVGEVPDFIAPWGRAKSAAGTQGNGFNLCLQVSRGWRCRCSNRKCCVFKLSSLKEN